MRVEQDRRITLGSVAGVYGLKGWLKVFSHTSPRAAILDYADWQLGGAERWTAVSVEAGRVHGKGIVVKLTGCDGRDEAAALLGQEIAVWRSQLPEIDPGEYYWSDLTGCEVRTADGISLGRVSHLIETGSNDVLVVRGERERLVPFIEQDVITHVDLEHGEIVVDWDPTF